MCIRGGDEGLGFTLDYVITCGMRKKRRDKIDLVLYIVIRGFVLIKR